MTVATKFSADGVENGLPFCFSADDVVDVSLPSYAGLKFTTFSGVTDQNYATLTAEEIEAKVSESFSKLITLFWNYEGIVGSSSDDAAELGVVFDEEPKERVCKTGTFEKFSDATLSGISNYTTAFYDGDTFLGYGGYRVGDYFLANADMGGGTVLVAMVGSYTPNTIFTRYYETSYATVNGISFLFVGQGPDDGNTTVTLTDTTLAAENTDGSSASITEIKFYTYA